MKTRFVLALGVFALSLGLAEMAPAASSITSQQCLSFCARVRCAYPNVCGLYTNANGVTACGCHDPGTGIETAP